MDNKPGKIIWGVTIVFSVIYCCVWFYIAYSFNYSPLYLYLLNFLIIIVTLLANQKAYPSGLRIDMNIPAFANDQGIIFYSFLKMIPFKSILYLSYIIIVIVSQILKLDSQLLSQVLKIEGISNISLDNFKLNIFASEFAIVVLIAFDRILGQIPKDKMNIVTNWKKIEWIKKIRKGADNMPINPTIITGNWDKGYVLDKHVLSSTPKGENVYGHMEFDTTRTELGELVFLLKNRGKQDAVCGIIDMIKHFLDNWEELKTVDIVLPVPPSKKYRAYQPASEIAEAIAEYLDVSFTDDVLEKTTSEQSKNMNKADKSLKGSIVAKLKAKKPHSILLVDDLYSTGETLTECVSVLRNDPNLKNIYVLAMTKTK